MTKTHLFEKINSFEDFEVFIKPIYDVSVLYHLEIVHHDGEGSKYPIYCCCFDEASFVWFNKTNQANYKHDVKDWELVRFSYWDDAARKAIEFIENLIMNNQ